MRCAVIFYHKNIHALYKPEWINNCIESIRRQSLQNFDVFELNYGNTSKPNKYAKGIRENYTFMAMPMENHIEAMNYLIDHCFETGYDVVFNTNMDDIYHPQRFQLQLQAIKHGAQLVSSNFYYFDDARGNFKHMKMDTFDIGSELKRNHNIIAHPVIAMHKSFWNNGLRYKNILGSEDLDLWKRGFAKLKKFVILRDYLLQYRIHKNQITKTHKGI